MLALAIIILSSIIGMVLRGASLDVFWDWFIAGPAAPFYHHAPNITFAQALGLSLVVSFLTYQMNADNDDDDDLVEGLVINLGKGLVFYAIFWLFAIIYHAMMQ